LLDHKSSEFKWISYWASDHYNKDTHLGTVPERKEGSPYWDGFILLNYDQIW